MKKTELVFIPSPGPSHFVSAVEMAKLLLERDDRLTITILIMEFPNAGTYIKKTISYLKKSPALRLLNLPAPDHDQISHAVDIIHKQTPHVRETISNLIQNQDSDSQLSGLVLDMFCSIYLDVAREFGLPSYIFFTSSASALGALAQHLVEMRYEHNQDLAQLINSDIKLSVPYFTKPVPAKVLPLMALQGGPVDLLFYFEKFRETNGIMVNTFHELESYAIDALNSHGHGSNKLPKVYPVGPILNQSNQSFDDDDDVKKWLDEQPENSVVFLCFGTRGYFDEAQVREIAIALENSGVRFLWSLRLNKGLNNEDLGQVLPDGFLVRTKLVGKVVGWAAQVAVLSHAAVGGFLSHCGWNSTLESLWFGVPIATFPLYAEQQMNAFHLVEEMGMAEAITLDYQMDFTPHVVGWEQIAAALRRLMTEEGGSEVTKKVKEMQSKARTVLLEGGSSYHAQNIFIQDVITNINACLEH